LRSAQWIAWLIGFKEDVVSLELFRPEYYEMDLDDVFRIGKEKSIRVLERNFSKSVV
jgi:2-keto-myo-inositol isomerase